MYEVIICSACGKDNCTVDEIKEREEISMEDYAARRCFPNNVWSTFGIYNTTTRRFVITCQHCGHQLEFLERVETNIPQYSLTYAFEELDYEPET